MQRGIDTNNLTLQYSDQGEYVICDVKNGLLGLYFIHYRQDTHVTLGVNSLAAQALLADLIDGVTQVYEPIRK